MSIHTQPLAILALSLSLGLAPLWAHTLTVEIEPQGTAGLVMDREGSYLADAQGQPVAYFGGWDGWGKEAVAPASVTFKTLSALPTSLNIVWLDGDDDQFWGGRMALPRQDIVRLLRQHPQEGFSRLIVSLADKGRLTLWLGSSQHEVQLGDEWQAQKTDRPWADFIGSLPSTRQGQSRAEFVKTETKRRTNPYNDELFVFLAEKQPIANFTYRITRDDGFHYCGHSNAQGETRRVNTGTTTANLSVYSGTCTLLEQEPETPNPIRIVPNVIRSMQRLLPY